MMTNRSGIEKKITIYAERSTKTWHRYADILVPLVTLPLLVIIGIYLHKYIVDPFEQAHPSKWKVFALSSALLFISFGALCYMFIRLSPQLGRKGNRINFAFSRNTRANGCYMRSVNSDLQFVIPFNNNPPTYESIIFDVPPCYTVVAETCKNATKIEVKKATANAEIVV